MSYRTMLFRCQPFTMMKEERGSDETADKVRKVFLKMKVLKVSFQQEL